MILIHIKSMVQGNIIMKNIQTKILIEKKMEHRIKQLFHIIAISLFLLGMTLIHTVLNNQTNTFIFFNLILGKMVVIDSAILFSGIAFFIEFFLTFKPIKIMGEE